jgi:hypothetical protein
MRQRLDKFDAQPASKSPFAPFDQTVLAGNAIDGELKFCRYMRGSTRKNPSTCGGDVFNNAIDSGRAIRSVKTYITVSVQFPTPGISLLQHCTPLRLFGAI